MASHSLIGENMKPDLLEHLQRLAGLVVPEGEREAFASELARMIDYVRRVRSLAAEVASETKDGPAERPTILRDDLPGKCLSAEDVFRGAPAVADALFVTPPLHEREE